MSLDFKCCVLPFCAYCDYSVSRWAQRHHEQEQCRRERLHHVRGFVPLQRVRQAHHPGRWVSAGAWQTLMSELGFFFFFKCAQTSLRLRRVWKRTGLHAHLLFTSVPSQSCIRLQRRILWLLQGFPLGRFLKYFPLFLSTLVSTVGRRDNWLWPFGCCWWRLYHPFSLGLKEVIYLSDKYHNTPGMIASRRLLDLAGIQYRYRRTPVSRLLLRVIFRIICLIENAKSWQSDIKSSGLWCMQVTAQHQQTGAFNEHCQILLWEHLETQSQNPDGLFCFFFKTFV